MSTSGINISSLLSDLGSSSSGINVQSAVQAAISAMSEPEQQWETEQQTLQTQTSALQSIENDVSTLESSLTTLNDPTGALMSMSASSSNSSIVTASAAAGAVAGNHVVVVTNLATAGSWYSSSVASGDTTLSSGSFQLQVGSGSAVTIPIGTNVDGNGTNTNTLNLLATYVNNQNLGVTASVVTDSSGARLAIVSNSTGAASNVTVSNWTGGDPSGSQTGISFTQAVVGKDAALTVDGIPIDSASNTVTGAVTGLTFDLQGQSPGTQVNVSVAPDASQISQAINSFVTAYNTVVGDINTQYTVNSSNNEGPLAGDSTVAMLQDSVLSAATYSAGSGSVTSLADLGITENNDGTLSVDSSTLNNAIQNNFSAVQSFLQGSKLNGFAATLNTQLNTFTNASNGAFTVDLQSISSENTDLQNQINDFQSYLQAQQTLLTNEYNQADILMQELPTQLEQINAELGLNTNNNSNNSGG
jgi:flagellar hook-associated protein 2